MLQRATAGRRGRLSWLGLAVLSLLCSAPYSAATAGEAVDLSTYRGHVVYLDFWASWCTPCRESFPWMDTVQRTYAQRGLVVIGMNVDRDRQAADQFLQALKPGFQIAFDPRGALAESFKVVGMPETFLIDRSGKIRYRHIGFRPGDETALDQQVRQLLAESR